MRINPNIGAAGHDAIAHNNDFHLFAFPYLTSTVCATVGFATTTTTSGMNRTELKTTKGGEDCLARRNVSNLLHRVYFVNIQKFKM